MRKTATILMHQFIATPVIFVVAIVITAGMSLAGNGPAVNPPIPTGVISSLFSALFALAAGFIVAHVFPSSANLGYWTWVLPTVIWLLLVITALTHHQNPFMFLIREANDEDTSFYIYNMIWVQAIFYPLGICLKRIADRQSTTGK